MWGINKYTWHQILKKTTQKPEAFCTPNLQEIQCYKNILARFPGHGLLHFIQTWKINMSWAFRSTDWNAEKRCNSTMCAINCSIMKRAAQSTHTLHSKHLAEGIQVWKRKCLMYKNMNILNCAWVSLYMYICNTKILCVTYIMYKAYEGHVYVGVVLLVTIFRCLKMRSVLWL